MSWESLKTWFSKELDRPLVSIADTNLSIGSIVTFILIIGVTFVTSLLVQRAMRKFLAKSFRQKEGTLSALTRLTHYVVMFIGIGIALQTIGVNMNALFAAGAVFAVAIGFAMQNIVQNFVSGIILLVERSIKPGDILEVDGKVVKVIEMGIRTTVVRTWRDEDIIMPNSTLAQSQVTNYTLKDRKFRVGITVGVTYSSDMKKVQEVLEQVVKSQTWALKEPEPRILLQDFGSSSVDFSIYLSVTDPWNQRVYASDLRKAVWFAFKEAGIVIAFPQVDVHFDPEVAQGLGSLNKVV